MKVLDSVTSVIVNVLLRNRFRLHTCRQYNEFCVLFYHVTTHMPHHAGFKETSPVASPPPDYLQKRCFNAQYAISGLSHISEMQ